MVFWWIVGGLATSLSGWGFYRKYKQGKSFFPSKDEWGLIGKSDPVIQDLAEKNLRVEEATKKKEKVAEVEKARETNAERHAKSEEERDEDEAGRRGADAAKQQSKSEKDLAAITGRFTGIVAALKGISDSIVKFVKKETTEEKEEERFEQYANQLIQHFEKLASLGSINASVVLQLRGLFAQLKENIFKEVKKEKERHENMLKVLEFFKNAVKLIKQELDKIKTLEGMLVKFENKKRGDLKAEIKKVKAAISAKKKEISAERKKGKDADKSIIFSLLRDIKNMERQLSTASNLQKDINRTIGMIKKMIKSLKKLVKNMLNVEKKLGKEKKPMNDAKQQSKKRFEEVEEASKKLTDIGIMDDWRSSVLMVGSEMNIFTRKMKNLVVVDSSLNKVLMEIVDISLNLTKQCEASQDLLKGINDAELVIDGGMEALEELLSNLNDDPRYKANKREVEKTTKEVEEITKIEQEVEKNVKQYTKAIQAQMKGCKEWLKYSMEEDKRLLNLLETNSKMLGILVNIAVNHRVKLGGETINRVENLRKQMRRRNPRAAREMEQSKTKAQEAMAA